MDDEDYATRAEGIGADSGPFRIEAAVPGPFGAAALPPPTTEPHPAATHALRDRVRVQRRRHRRCLTRALPIDPGTPSGTASDYHDHATADHHHHHHHAAGDHHHHAVRDHDDHDDHHHGGADHHDGGADHHDGGAFGDHHDGGAFGDHHRRAGSRRHAASGGSDRPVATWRGRVATTTLGHVPRCPASGGCA